MDVNGSKFHLMLGERDWLPLLIEQRAEKLWWDRSRQQLTLAPEILEIPAASGVAAFTTDDRRGAAYDHYGNVYWINQEQDEVLFRPSATPARMATYWSVDRLHDECETENQSGDFTPVQPPAASPTPLLRGLTVTTHEYMVVGTLQPGGILVFDLHAGGPPQWLLWPQSVAFAPFDMSPAPDGGLWILDRSNDSTHRFWRLDRFFKVMPCSGSSVEIQSAGGGLFNPVDGRPASPIAFYFPEGNSLQLSSPLSAVNPYAIEALPDGSVLILTLEEGDDASVIYHFIDGELNTAIVLDRAVLGELLTVDALRAHDFGFVQSADFAGGGVQGSLFVIALSGKQAFKFILRVRGRQVELGMQSAFLPLRNYSGKGIVSTAAETYYDYGDIWLPLAEQPRRRYKTLTSAGARPSLAGIVFDGKEPELVWHRLVLDACIPNGTAVHIESRAANEPELLQDRPWYQEPKLYLRADGSDLPYHDPFAGHDNGDAGMGSWEVLFQQARGRYLELRITLEGTGRSSPMISALRAYYPRFSYLNEYLPAVYRQDVQSAGFLDRFLANVEGLYTVLEGRIELAEILLDSRTAPAEYLEWLAGWLGAMMDPAWSDQRRRLFLDYAELLFRWRGTQIGMRAAIRLTIDPCPDESVFDELKDQRSLSLGSMGGRSVRISENFLVRTNPRVVVGDPTAPKMLELNATDEPWSPQQGAAPLHRRFQEFGRRLYRDGDAAVLEKINENWRQTYSSIDEIKFPPVLPEEEAFARDWRLFTRDVIGFTYAPVEQTDKLAYQGFLERRYQQIERLNQAYLLGETRAYKSFTQIELPDRLPAADKPLSDWIEFVSLVLPIERNAHRFAVLVPTQLHESYYERLRHMAQAEEVVAREKPAHTEFEVKLYWALFQVGSARLGLDTSIGEGSRFVALVLGSNYLGQSYLSESHPWGIGDRQVIGRDRLSYTRSMENRNG